MVGIQPSNKKGWVVCPIQLSGSEYGLINDLLQGKRHNNVKKELGAFVIFILYGHCHKLWRELQGDFVVQ